MLFGLLLYIRRGLGPLEVALTEGLWRGIEDLLLERRGSLSSSKRLPLRLLLEKEHTSRLVVVDPTHVSSRDDEWIEGVLSRRLLLLSCNGA